MRISITPTIPPVAFIKLTGGNQTTTSNVAANITDLVYPVEANSVYTIDGIIQVGCNNTGGVKLGVDIPAASTMAINLHGWLSAVTSFSANFLTSDGTLGTVAYCTVNSSGDMLAVNGTVTTGANAGNIQFIFASGTNTQTSTIFQEGTFLRIQKVA